MTTVDPEGDIQPSFADPQLRTFVHPFKGIANPFREMDVSSLWIEQSLFLKPILKL
jgi:hypothetical protein